MSFLQIALHGKVRHEMSHDVYPNPVSCGCFNPQWDGELWQRQCRVFFGALAEAHLHPTGAAPPFTVTSPQTLCPAFTYLVSPSVSFNFAGVFLQSVLLWLLCVNLNAIPLKMSVYFCSRCLGWLWLPTLRGWVSYSCAVVLRVFGVSSFLGCSCGRAWLVGPPHVSASTWCVWTAASVWCSSRNSE